MRSLTGLLVISCLLPVSAFAQAPDSAPIVLSVPASARVSALGGAWVSGRDQDVLFYNPAQLIGTRQDFSVSLARLGPTSSTGALTSTYTGGKWSFTLGWGLQVLNFKTFAGGPIPYSQASLVTRGDIDAQSSVAAVGGAIVYKSFRIGASAKYASERTTLDRHAWLADLGVARSLFGGVAAFSAQNLGRSALDEGSSIKIPRQMLMGWSTTRPAGPLDLGIYTQVTKRSGWTSPAAGLEVGYSWIEGYLVTVRAGARRPDVAGAKPMTIGGGLSADRLTVDYGLEFFDNGHRAHRVTIRWR
jgi:hypothetical protein